MLKVAWRHDEAAHEAAGLRAWDGHGTVRLHDSDVFGSTSVLLLERCRPGTTLATPQPEPDQDVVVAGAAATVVDGADRRGHVFRPLQVDV